MAAWISLIAIVGLEPAADAHGRSQPAGERDVAPRVSAQYSKPADRTDVSLTLTPTRADGSEPPFRLLFSASYPGRRVRRAPAVVQVTAQPHPLAVVAGLTFEFTVDRGERVDLAAAGRSCRYTYPCDECGATGIVVQATLDEIRRIASAGRLDGNVLGFAIQLNAADRDALRQFVARLSPEPERPVPPRIVPPVFRN